MCAQKSKHLAKSFEEESRANSLVEIVARLDNALLVLMAGAEVSIVMFGALHHVANAQAGPPLCVPPCQSYCHHFAYMHTQPL